MSIKNRNKIKILLSVGSLGIGGNEIFAMNLFRSIDRNKFHIDFVTYNSERLDFYNEIVNAGSNVFFSPRKSSNKYIQFFYDVSYIRKLLKKYHYDIIHVNSCSLLGILKAAIPAKIVGNTKIISHAHNPGMPKETFFDNFTRNVAKAILSTIVDMGFSCSDVAGQSKYTKKFINSDKYVVINNAIDIEKYSFNSVVRYEKRRELGIDDHTLLIGNIGRLEAQKNQSFLLDIFFSVHQANPNSKLVIIGEGSLLADLKQKCVNLAITDNVIFLGKRVDAEKYYNAFDCFVLPSLYEGLPFVLVEAQINGLQCFISNVITKDINVSGTIKYITLTDKASWVKSILDNGIKRIDKSNVDKVKKRYDSKLETRKIEKLYMKLVFDNNLVNEA